jgi:hypothetical protein
MKPVYFISRYIIGESQKEEFDIGKLETTFPLTIGINLICEHFNDKREDFGLFSGKIENINLDVSRHDRYGDLNLWKVVHVTLEQYDMQEAAKKYNVPADVIKERISQYVEIEVTNGIRGRNKARKETNELCMDLSKGLDTVLGCVQ